MIQRFTVSPRKTHKETMYRAMFYTFKVSADAIILASQPRIVACQIEFSLY